MSLPPIAIGMVGLAFALWGNGLLNLGVDAEPQHDGAASPAKSVAVASSLIGAITLLFTSVFLIVAAPLGTAPIAIKLQLLFSAITGMYGLQFLATTIVQLNGWDPRPIGNFALLTVPIQIVEMVLLAQYAKPAGISMTHLVAQEVTFAAFVLAGIAIWRGTHGKLSSRVVGCSIMLAFVGTLYFLFFAGGLIEPPA
jgi:hypothetical protein